MGGGLSCIFINMPELSDDLFDRFYHTVLAPAFPPEELEDIETVRTLYYEPSPPVPGLVALRAGDPVGGTLGEYYSDGNVVLLAYQVVRADCRGIGIGSALLTRALHSWRELLAPSAIVAEVEDPRGRHSGPHGDPKARLRFYERMGGKLLPLSYFQPSLGRGLPRVRGMLLVCLDPERNSLPKHTVLAFLDEYMEAAEGSQASTADREYLDLRAQVNAWPHEVPLWPLSHFTRLPSPAANVEKSERRES
jgi:GNAT superfamily N-acetyltransferase